jgi:hypothetical protein
VAPVVADDGPALLTARSALALPNAVVAVALLFAAFGSGVVLDTVAELATLVPAKFAAVVKVLVIVFVWPGVIVPRAHGNALVQAPVFEEKLVPAGVGSATETAAASEGPLFVMVIV